MGGRDLKRGGGKGLAGGLAYLHVDLERCWFVMVWVVAVVGVHPYAI